MNPSQQVDERSEQERQQHRERNRDQHRAAEVETGNDHDTDSDGQQTAQTRRLGRWDLEVWPVLALRAVDPPGAGKKVLIRRPGLRRVELVTTRHGFTVGSRQSAVGSRQ